MVKVGVVGAGIGGLSAAIALERYGYEVVIFEQAPVFGHVGADVNLTPNAVRALDGLGIGDTIRQSAARPEYRISRMWDTGEYTSRIAMSDAATIYGAPQLTMHRADLLEALRSAVSEGSIQFDHRVTSVRSDAAGATLSFDHQPDAEVDLVVGADGIHSVVRESIFGPEHPTFTGIVAFRAVVPLSGHDHLTNRDAFTKWWGPTPEVQIVTFPLNRGKDMFIFATTPQDAWRYESWTQPGDSNELRELYKDFHSEARAYLDVCSDVLKSALYVRDPLDEWNRGRVVLLGDASHPMMPFMAQGAGQAIEDAVVLARCLQPGQNSGVDAALRQYQRARIGRTSRIQAASRENKWLKAGEDAGWLYSYDAWNTPLD